MLFVITIAVILIIVVVRKVSSENRKRQIEELKQLILGCDKGKWPLCRVEDFCRGNGIADSEYHEIRKNLYYELAKEDDVFALKMAAAYAYDENRALEIKYKTRAAELGDVDSMYSLGIAYKYDKSCPGYPNMDSAFYWFKQAAELGHEKAIVETAQAYHDGEGVEKNEDIAFAILKDYSDRGYSKCSQELAHHYYQSPSSSHFDLRLAEQTYIRIIHRGDPEAFADAVNRLGYIYGGSYIFGNPTDEYSDRRKAAYCLALAHFTDPDLYDTDDLIKVGYRWTENEMRKWAEDAQNLRYNPV